MSKSTKKLQKFSINNKKFKKQYYKSINDGILLKYNILYSNDTFKVEYFKKKNEYSFLVYKDMLIISKDNTTINDSILLAQYTNIEAIKLFSTISMEEYLNEYDDSKKDYLEQLKQYIDGVSICYKLLNVPINIEEVSNLKYLISFEKPDKNSHSFFHNYDIICGFFRYDIVTEEEFIGAKKYIKKQMDQIYEKYKSILK